MDLESVKLKQIVNSLKKYDPQLAYLAVLTAHGVKPLSRWEKPLEQNQLDLMHQLSLQTASVRRTVQTGNEIFETIFSPTPAYIKLYNARFADNPIDKSDSTQHLEGFLFGFPPCCVDQYIKTPYAKNNLPSEKQAFLFHWACKNCLITPKLLPQYQKIHQYIKN
ncbi:MAG: hypothetical protein GY869_16470, partial [Planctomycetes bacterium]|nr:hypothetical protein [Planctomycetota bacterium]